MAEREDLPPCLLRPTRPPPVARTAAAGRTRDLGAASTGREEAGAATVRQGV